LSPRDIKKDKKTNKEKEHTFGEIFTRAKQVKHLPYRINKIPGNKNYINNEKIRPENEKKQELRHRQKQNKSWIG